MRRPFRWGAALGAAAALAACDHAQPFGAPDLGPNVPFSSALPRQLTFSSGSDLAPAWLPDGSGIIYSFLRLDRADRDRCLGVLPAEGGRIVQTICHYSLLDPDTTNTLWDPAVGPGGVLAYVRESSVPGAPGPQSRELVVASLQNPDPGRVVRTLPYVAPDGTLHATATHLTWVDAATLVYIAEGVLYTFPPGSSDTILSPIEAVRIRLAGDSVALAVMPGTANATSITADSAGTIYFTLLGDSVIYRLDPGAGAPTAVFDFRAIGVVRDVRFAHGRLFAVAGHGTAADIGGDVYVVDPVAGTARPVAPQRLLWFRRPAPSPSGLLVAAEGYALTLQPRFPGVDNTPVDTIVSRSADLYLLPVP